MKLLGLTAILCIIPFAHLAYAVGDSPVIVLNGANPQTIVKNYPYVELGATASDTEDGDLTASIIIDSSAVDTSTIGSYTVTYDVTDSDLNTDHVERTVNVVAGDSPVILLTGANPQSVLLHDAYVEAGATASDTEDGDLTGSIVIDSSSLDVDTLGSYIISYDVIDSSGNTAHEERTVNVITGDSPIITILGNNPENVVKNAAYVDAGATASDTEDGDLTGSIITVNPVDTSTIGVYVVTYDVTDSNGNTSHAERTVNVIAGNSPTFTLIGANPQFIALNQPYVELGANACDDVEDGLAYDTPTIDFSAVNTALQGSYLVHYTCTDSSDNDTIIDRTVTVNLGDSPVILLTGANPQSINLHDPYVELGATASDTEDGDLTSSIVIDSSAVDVDTLGSYIVTYDVTDSSGNTDHEERTVNVITGNAPVITILGDNPSNIDYETTYTDSGATASDMEDGDLTGSIVQSGSVDTTIGGYSATTYIISYDVTDSNGNTAHAERIVNVAGKISHGDYCTGDCTPPTIGIDSNGRRMVDWPVVYKTPELDFRQLAEYFHTPMKDFTVKVGEMNQLQFVVYENSGYDAIRQVGLSIGVPFSGTFNDGAATLRWYAAQPGEVVGDQTDYIVETDPDNIFELKYFDTERVECNPNTTGNNNCMGVTIKYIFREAPKDTAIRLDIWDEKLNAFQHVLNEGVTVRGDSMNGPDVFTAMASNGYQYTLTTTNDYAVDQNGDRWSYDGQFWSKDLKPITNALDDAKELAKDKEAAKAALSFDGSKLQKTITPVKDFIPEHYDRLHDPVPNMIKAYIDYAKSKAGHS